jgi:hypothetical protein
VAFANEVVCVVERCVYTLSSLLRKGQYVLVGDRSIGRRGYGSEMRSSEFGLQTKGKRGGEGRPGGEDYMYNSID